MHINKAICPKCLEVLAKYPGFYKPLQDWVLAFRTAHIDAHISSGGRGRADQELFFKKGLSRAHYGQSSHSFNAAIDLFRLTQANNVEPLVASFESAWYRQVVGPAANANPNLRWYGKPPITFMELPHIEWANWRELARQGVLKLVDGESDYKLPGS